MRKLIASYKHLMGSHCSSSLIAAYATSKGLPLNEDLAFGIGAGLGFIYRKAFTPRIYFVNGRGDNLEETAFFNLGGMALGYVTDDAERAWLEVKRRLDADEPTILNVDASYLPYFRKKFELFEHVRYGGHRVMIVGYDEEAGTAFLADYGWSTLQEISLDDLRQARAANDGQIPANNLFYTILFPEVTAPLAGAVIKGIRLNTRTMLTPWVPQVGLSGLQKFCERILGWGNSLPEDLLMRNLKMIHMMLEVVGTGGGNFRRMYSRFLLQAATICGEPRFEDISRNYAEMGQRWKEVANLIKASSENLSEGLYGQPDLHQKLLDELYQSELAAMSRLKEIVA